MVHPGKSIQYSHIQNRGRAPPDFVKLADPILLTSLRLILSASNFSIKSSGVIKITGQSEVNQATESANSTTVDNTNASASAVGSRTQYNEMSQEQSESEEEEPLFDLQLLNKLKFQ